MLITFTTKYHADITMFGDVGLAMLKMMGNSGTVPGALVADDVADALEKLQAAVDAQNETIESDNDDEPAVSLHNRALPLIDLLETAVKEGSDVMWE